MGQIIELTAADGGTFAGYLATPEITPAPGIVLLPEVFNTNDHIRSVVDGYAEAGFVVIAPDVYWREEAGQYLSYTDEGREKAQSLRAAMNTDQFIKDLGDVAAILKDRDDCTGKVGVMGFCLGGKFTYLAGTRLPIQAGVSYYGVQIDEHLDEADNLGCPILMNFASDDPHVPQATVDAIRARMGDWDNVDVHVYPGTEHGFNRYGYPPHNEAAAAKARERTLAHFRAHLS
ncbi:MAG: dienelactone hydrolase family protein [Alphaproteobacteria bacterium]|nr:dienelactone hydrolase family protein [Alphaproteobacteria bacterium]